MRLPADAPHRQIPCSSSHPSNSSSRSCARSTAAGCRSRHSRPPANPTSSRRLPSRDGLARSQALLLGISNLRRMAASFSGRNRLVREQLFPSCSPNHFPAFHNIPTFPHRLLENRKSTPWLPPTSGGLTPRSRAPLNISTWTYCRLYADLKQNIASE